MLHFLGVAGSLPHSLVGAPCWLRPFRALVAESPPSPPSVPQAIRRCCEFLLSKQREDGGWGESYLSCQDKVRARGHEAGGAPSQSEQHSHTVSPIKDGWRGSLFHSVHASLHSQACSPHTRLLYRLPACCTARCTRSSRARRTWSTRAGPCSHFSWAATTRRVASGCDQPELSGDIDTLAQLAPWLPPVVSHLCCRASPFWGRCQ